MDVPVRYFIVQYNGQWRVEFEDKHWNGFTSRKEAVKSAVDAAREKAKTGKPVEVLVHEEDNLWHTEWASKDRRFKVT